MKKHTFHPLLFTLLFLSSTLYAEPKTIKIDTNGKAMFEVFYHRVGTNNTGAAIGGLIGAGIQAGIESDKDAKKTQELQPHVNQEAWKELFINEVNETLKGKDYIVKWVDKTDKKNKDPLITLYPENYGFKLVDTNTRLVSAFVSFKAQLTHKGEKHEKQDYYIVHKSHRSY